MSNASRQSVCSMLLILFLFIAASKVQAQAPVTEFDRQMARVTLGVLGAGMINSKVSGTIINTNVTQSLDTSNTVGALATLRYVVKPYVGLEANYSYARYNENFSNFTIPPSSPCNNISCASPGAVQTRVNEYTLGWVVHLPSLLGATPFASAGLGSTGFTPTGGGGRASRRRRARRTTTISVSSSLSCPSTLAFVRSSVKSSSRRPTLARTTSPSTNTPVRLNLRPVFSCVFSRIRHRQGISALQSQRLPNSVLSQSEVVDPC